MSRKVFKTTLVADKGYRGVRVVIRSSYDKLHFVDSTDMKGKHEEEVSYVHRALQNVFYPQNIIKRGKKK